MDVSCRLFRMRATCAGVFDFPEKCVAFQNGMCEGGFCRCSIVQPRGANCELRSNAPNVIDSA